MKPSAPTSVLDLGVDLPWWLRTKFGQQPVLGQHRLHDQALFSDDALIALLDRFPRQHLYAHSMGNDPARLEDNHRVAIGDIDGAALLTAVKAGRLWLNLTRIDRAEAPYRQLISSLYEALSAQIPGFMPDASQGTLLISSPEALVYYHADAPASVLWHIRGRKRVWVYPALDHRYLAPELLEDIFAGVRHEYLPYLPAYDHAAVVHDLRPGQWLAWPQNAPHRVSNLDSVNVSLSTEHFTAASRRRFRVRVANRWFRIRLGFRELSTREDGAMAWAKTLTQRMARNLGLDPVKIHQQRPSLRLVAKASGHGHGVEAVTGDRE
ncbi:hypothetical protein [uncultured Nevskia sp.]|uniref:hypothetical protein n=1 Tax=uncultured Nevskia sp. TaxID=228950 RepID=UPI0025E12685|nr:hypothetical protein [uncultured Nevskia sp.]